MSGQQLNKNKSLYITKDIRKDNLLINNDLSVKNQYAPLLDYDHSIYIPFLNTITATVQQILTAEREYTVLIPLFKDIYSITISLFNNLGQFDSIIIPTETENGQIKFKLSNGTQEETKVIIEILK